MKAKNISKIIKQTWKDSMDFSFGVAIARTVQMFPFVSWEKRRTYYEKKVYQYLSKYCIPVIKKCVAEFEPEKSVLCEEMKIWVMWWQGLDDMPPLVKACYNQMLKVIGDKNVTLITRWNIEKYIDIPEFILKKKNEGKISLTHFSDIVRIFLLKKYGGVWLDATIYMERYPKAMFDRELFTLHAPGIFPEFISRGDWSTFVIATNRMNTLFTKCLYEVFCEYWKQHDRIIDYLMFDYFICIVRDNIGEINRKIQLCPKNYNYYNLNIKINEAYSEMEFRQILSDSFIQKLTYKKEFLDKTNNGELTNYHYLVTEKAR